MLQLLVDFIQKNMINLRKEGDDMKLYSKEVHNFLVNIVLPKLNYEDYNEDNIGDIVEYIFSNIEGPLCDKEVCGEVLNENEKELLQIATKSITEITTREDWDC